MHMKGTSRREELIAFIRRVVARNPELKAQYAKRLREQWGLEADVLSERAALPEAAARREAAIDDLPVLLGRSSDLMLETIVSEERPVLFIEQNGLNFTDATVI